MLRYFPFGESFDPGVGMRILKPHEPLCDVDPNTYGPEIALKQRLLTQDHPFYFKGGPGTMSAQWDVLELVMTNLARIYPETFRLRQESNAWCWHNTFLSRETSFGFGDSDSLPAEPLDWIGRQVQEDLVLLSDDSTATFIGGQLCFANGWDIADRVGKSFLEIHRRTPMATMASVETGSRFLQSLKPGHTYWRTSWNFKLSNQLDMTTKHEPAYKTDFAIRAPRLTADDVGMGVFIRIERQTFTRLPRSKALLFGIHTYNSPVAEEAADPHRARSILNVVQTAPRAVKDYKAITPIERALVEFLESSQSE